jgi:hypothetical protein
VSDSKQAGVPEITRKNSNIGDIQRRKPTFQGSINRNEK